MTDDDETASSDAVPPPLPAASAAETTASPGTSSFHPSAPTPAAERQATWLYRAALVAGPLAAVLGAVASAEGAGRLPDAFQASPAKTFVVLVNLFFCLPYLAAFAFAFTARDVAHRPHRHAVLHALLTFGMLALWTLVLVFARPR